MSDRSAFNSSLYYSKEHISSIIKVKKALIMGTVNFIGISIPFDLHSFRILHKKLEGS
jgi:hypothetical protein